MDKYTVIFESPTSAGESWGAYVPDLPGCIGLGPTRDECRASVAESIRLYLEHYRTNGLAVPLPSSEAESLAAA